jgi:heme oxygenase
VTLSELLREGTAAVHRQAEGSAFVSRFVQGTLDRALFAAHLRALHPVYEELESALDANRADARLGAFHLPELWRTAAIETDLAFFRGAAWRDDPPVSAAGEYAAHLAEVRRSRPLRLVSHAYVRYLGDLSGGQMLKKMAARHLGLTDRGLAFYEFPLVASAGAAKADFRRRLDALEIDDGERDDLLDEAKRAFVLNGAIFAELVA